MAIPRAPAITMSNRRGFVRTGAYGYTLPENLLPHGYPILYPYRGSLYDATPL